MTEITIRQLTTLDEQLDALIALGGYAFEPSPPLPKHDDWRKWVGPTQDSIYLAAMQDEQPVSLVVSTPMPQNVRGRIYNAGGVWGVATLPQARRKGYVRQLLHHLFTQRQAAGEIFTNLYAFRESFYTRLGYVAFPMPRTVQFRPDALAPLLRQELDGSVEMLAIKDGLDLYYDYLERKQQTIHGMVVFDRKFRESMRDDNNYWLAVARDAGGQIIGMMPYNIKGQHDDYTLRARVFFYDNPLARYLLLQWIARHIDHVDRVRVRFLPGERPGSWLTDLRVEPQFDDPPLGRVLDVATMGGMTVGPGAFSAHITDDLCPWNTGAYHFESNNGVLRVEPVDSAPVSLTIQGLTALVYGTHDPADFVFRGWGDPDTDQQAAMRALFPMQQPYLYEDF